MSRHHSQFPPSGCVRWLYRRRGQRIYLFRKPEHAADEWLAEITRLLVRLHKTESYREGPNLLPNPGFEVTGTDGLPEGWKRRDYQNSSGNLQATWSVVTDPGWVHSGKQAVRVASGVRADTSLHADLTLNPNIQYRLSAWLKSKSLQGKISLNDHINRFETDLVTAANSDWTEIEVVFRGRNLAQSSINILFVANGEMRGVSPISVTRSKHN